MSLHAISAHGPAYPRTPLTGPSPRPGEEGGASDSGRAEITAGKYSPKTRAIDRERQEELRALEQRDREVRAHEQAHLRAAGHLARGGASYTFVTGPDGRRYAIGGEVSIDTAPVPGDPRATLAKAEQIQRAALAPAEPSAQDRQVASEAAAMANRARVELARLGVEERRAQTPGASPGDGTRVRSVSEPGSTKAADAAGPDTKAHPAGCPHCAGQHVGPAHRAASSYGEVAALGR